MSVPFVSDTKGISFHVQQNINKHIDEQEFIKIEQKRSNLRWQIASVLYQGSPCVEIVHHGQMAEPCQQNIDKANKDV